MFYLETRFEKLVPFRGTRLTGKNPLTLDQKLFMQMNLVLVSRFPCPKTINENHSNHVDIQFSV
jgi:hypothetical protein